MRSNNIFLVSCRKPKYAEGPFKIGRGFSHLRFLQPLTWPADVLESASDGWPARRTA